MDKLVWMKHRKAKILIFACALPGLFLCLIAFYFISAPPSDEMRFRDMNWSKRLAKFAQSAESGPLSPIFKPLKLNAYFNHRSESDQERLYATGYLTMISAVDPTSGSSGMSLSARTIAAVRFKAPYYVIGPGDNFCNIYCRAKDIPSLKVALEGQGLAVAKD